MEMMNKATWLIRNTLLIISVFSLTGCGWRTWDLSEREPFQSYIGDSFTLQIPMTLRIREKYNYRFLPYTIMSEGTAVSLGEVVCKLPEGSKIKVNSVKMIEIDGCRSLYILGNVQELTAEKWVDFEILLGRYPATASEKLWLKRMPWESKDVPENRYIEVKDEKRSRLIRH